MSKIQLSFAELHNGLFLAGTNHGTKLQITKNNVQLVYDDEAQTLFVKFKNAIAIVPNSNVASMTPINADPFQLYFKPFTEVPVAPITHVNHPIRANIDHAQVSTPHDHVFATTAGLTGAPTPKSK
jgi:hypothetical protein